MSGYIRADQVTEGMVLDLTSPTNGDYRYFWRVQEAVTKTSTYLHLVPHVVDNPADWEAERTVRLRHDERVWCTGWGVQPEPPTEPLVETVAMCARYGFSDSVDIWRNEDGQTYVGGTWAPWESENMAVYANVPAEDVTVGTTASLLGVRA